MGKVEKTAKDWSFIDFSADKEHFAYRYVHEHIKDVNKAFGKVHQSCRVSFFMKLETFQKRYGNTAISVQEDDTDVEVDTSNYERRKSQRGTKKGKKFVSYVTELDHPTVNGTGKLA